MALALAEFFLSLARIQGLSGSGRTPPGQKRGRTGVVAGGMYLLAAIHTKGLLIVVGMIVSLVLILRSLYKQVRGSCKGQADLFGGRYPMGGEEPPVPEDLKKIRGRLLELGFPEYVLNDLSLEDIRACDGAFRVVVDISDQMVSEGWKRMREI